MPIRSRGYIDRSASTFGRTPRAKSRLPLLRDCLRTEMAEAADRTCNDRCDGDLRDQTRLSLPAVVRKSRLQGGVGALRILIAGASADPYRPGKCARTENRQPSSVNDDATAFG